LWEGNVQSIKGHIWKMHYLRAKNWNTVSATCRKILPYCNQQEQWRVGEWCWAMFCLGQLFLMNIKMIGFNLHFCLRHAGLQYKTPSYTYNILVHKQNGSERFLVSARTKVFLTDSQKTFQEKDSAIITENQWKQYTDEGNYSFYKAQISKN
jgi:hypothetical protein